MITTRPLAPLFLAAIIAGCDTVAPPEVAPAPPPAPRPAVTAAPLPVAAPEPVSLVVRGRILGHDKKPLALAHAHIGDRVAQAGADGRFTITAANAGFVPVRFTGVDHAPHTAGVFFDGPEVEVEVTLGTYERHAATLKSARAMLRVKDEDGKPPRAVGVARFTLQMDGTYLSVIDARADEMLYSLDYLVRDHQINGPVDEGVVHVGGGEYLSLIHARGKKKVILRIDPARLLPPALKPAVAFPEPTRAAARIAALWAGAHQRTDEGPAGRAAHAAWRAEIGRSIAGEGDARVAAAMRMAYLVPEITLDRASGEALSAARWLREALPPGAPMWAFWPEAAISAVDLLGRKAGDDAWLDEIGKGIAHRETAAAFLAARIRAASLAGRDDDLARLHPLMKERFADTVAAGLVTLFAPGRQVRPGRELPDFDLPLLADGPGAPRGARVTRASLRGKVAIIDFWGSWCVPCIREMRWLHETHARYKDRGLAVLSVAVNDKVASIKNFRRLQWSMPWSHVVLEPKHSDETIERFEIKSYPSPILVDREGKIIAIGDDLRGEGLRRAVDIAMDGR